MNVRVHVFSAHGLHVTMSPVHTQSNTYEPLHNLCHRYIYIYIIYNNIYILYKLIIQIRGKINFHDIPTSHYKFDLHAAACVPR